MATIKVVEQTETRLETSLPPLVYRPLAMPMLQDTQSIRYYQRLTDDMVDLWNRGSRYDEIRMYVDGYLACLRHSNVLEPYLVHRLEEEALGFLRDPYNFEYLSPQTQTEVDYY